MLRSLLQRRCQLSWTVALFATALALPAFSQTMLRPSKPDDDRAIRIIEAALASAAPESPLDCELEDRGPDLNFAFRHYVSYRVSLPMKQFSEEAIQTRIFLRVTPRNGSRPSYFWQSADIPPGPRPKAMHGEFGGGFFLGEGSYRVEWMIVDNQPRSCRGEWDVELKLNKDERKAASFLQPGELAPLELEWNGTADGRDRPFKVAIVLHAAPVFPRRSKLTSTDQSFLTTMLAALLEDTPFRESSLYVISMEKQKVLFEGGRLDRQNFSGLLEAMEDLNLGTIGAAQYFNPAGRFQVLAGVVNRELAAKEPPDAIVFIGPNSRHVDRFPQELLETAQGKKPKFFYLHLDYYGRRYPWPDTIERLTKSQGGKVFSIRQPKELMKALAKIEELLTTDQRSSRTSGSSSS